MEDLIRSLRNLGLKPPDPSQLWELLDEDKEVQTRLVKLLAFNVAPSDQEEEYGGGGGNDVAGLMGQDLLQEAVSALLDNFKRVLDKQRQTLQREEKILKECKFENGVSHSEVENGRATKGSKQVNHIPKKFKLPPRKALFLRHEAALRRDDEDRTSMRGYRPKLVFDGSISFHSKRNFTDLENILCKDLDVTPKRFVGKKLIVRVVTSLLLYVGVSLLAEDVEGNIIPISVSHFTSNVNATREEISKLLPIGTILAIREPFLSIDYQARSGPCSGKADIGIRVDSPTDIILLKEEEVLDLKWITELPISEDEQEINSIPWLYDPVKSTDWLSTAKKLQESGRSGAAYRAMLRHESENGEIDPSIRTSILFNLTAWQEARNALTKGNIELNGSTAPSDNKALAFGVPFSQLSKTDAAERCRLRMSQSNRGLTMNDVRSIYFAAPETPRFDISDYIGPVAVQEIDGAGRGLVLTRDVEPGELLLCCRAIGSAYPNDPESKNSPILRLNLSNGVVSTTSQIRAQTNLIHKIIDRSELSLPILGLTAGPKMANSDYVKQPYPMITLPCLADEKNFSNSSIDPAYIDGVLRFNAFGPAQAPDRKNDRDISSDSNSFTDFGELGKSTMPHPLPAILNHACLPNVSSIFFSDIVTTRALITMKKGTEIVHQYVRGEIPYAVRSAQLSKHGFECGCTLCCFDRADGVELYTQRARIMQGESSAIFERSRVLMKRIDLSHLGLKGEESQISEEDLDAHRDILNSLEQLFERVNNTYSTKRGGLRPDLLCVYEVMTKHVAIIHQADIRHDKVEEIIVKAVKCVGGSIERNNNDKQKGVFIDLPRLHMDVVIGLLLLASVILENAQMHVKAQSWCQAAFYAHQCMIGGGLDVFLDRWQLPEFEPGLRLLQAEIKK